jgi:hypothetical protein
MVLLDKLFDSEQFRSAPRTCRQFGGRLSMRQTARAEAPRAAIIVDPLLILHAGGGYHVLLAGMERISVELGQFVVTGEPVAVMGVGAQSAVAKAGGASKPVLYVEFRKVGIGQKVRG